MQYILYFSVLFSHATLIIKIHCWLEIILRVPWFLVFFHLFLIVHHTAKLLVHPIYFQALDSSWLINVFALLSITLFFMLTTCVLVSLLSLLYSSYSSLVPLVAIPILQRLVWQEYVLSCSFLISISHQWDLLLLAFWCFFRCFLYVLKINLLFSSVAQFCCSAVSLYCNLCWYKYWVQFCCKLLRLYLIICRSKVTNSSGFLIYYFHQ